MWPTGAWTSSTPIPTFSCRPKLSLSPPRRFERDVKREAKAYDGVTRYTSKTASTFLSAFKSVFSAFTSPSSAVYQFLAS